MNEKKNYLNRTTYNCTQKIDSEMVDRSSDRRSLIEAAIGCRLDTGHFFNTSLIQGLVFESVVKGQESKVWAFF